MLMESQLHPMFFLSLSKIWSQNTIKSMSYKSKGRPTFVNVLVMWNKEYH